MKSQAKIKAYCLTLKQAYAATINKRFYKLVNVIRL